MTWTIINDRSGNYYIGNTWKGGGGFYYLAYFNRKLHRHENTDFTPGSTKTSINSFIIDLHLPACTRANLQCKDQLQQYLTISNFSNIYIKKVNSQLSIKVMDMCCTRSSSLTRNFMFQILLLRKHVYVQEDVLFGHCWRFTDHVMFSVVFVCPQGGGVTPLCVR